MPLPTRRQLFRRWGQVALVVVTAGACGDDAKSDAGGPTKPEETIKYADPSLAVDMIIVGGRVYTLDPTKPEAEAVAIKDGAIKMIGTRSDIELLRGQSTKVIDLQGGVAVPGLTDAHAHLVGLGDHLATVDLRGATSIEEVVERLRSGAPKQGWVIGRGWDQNLWADPAMPTHEALSAAFPDRPVWLRRVDGHAGWANAHLLALAGVTAESEDPEGGEFLRDEEGNPTGVLVDAAMQVIEVPPPPPPERKRRLLAAQAHVLERGIVGLHEMGIGPEDDALYRELLEAGELDLRVHAYASERWFTNKLQGRKPDPVDPSTRYALIGVKVYVDGALGSRGAALLRPYSDRRGHRGKLMHSVRHFEKVALDAAQRDWQVAAHAIGDRGNRTILDAYGLVDQRMRHRDLRFRVEHAQIVDPEDIARFAKLRVIASMQPTHATSDMPWVPDRIGEKRLEGAYAWRRFVEAGVRLPLGSDFPVERVDITHGLHAAVTRQDADGAPEGGWLPDQRLSLDEAIAGFTREAAYAVHREEHLGAIKPGYRADLTCFSADLWKLDPAQLRDAEVSYTIIDGEVAYAARP